ncbi:MAG TPA: HTH domain-containing protein, partial [Candidatus Nanoarchaeia archaeon]|nr:HTH domain-containing protein [Candidatus Nanoarchaeia archaeon]
VFSVRNLDLLLVIESLCKERLTQKQKQILEYISSNQEEITITKLVDKLTVVLHCSHSTLWNNIRQLKRMEILQSHAKGSPIEITLIGKYISQKMKCGGDNDTNNRK